MCKLYQFNFFLQEETKWKHNLVVGDVQLRAFPYLVHNQVKCKRDMYLYEQCEKFSGMIVISEHALPEEAIKY